jgi:hypothetical protein
VAAGLMPSAANAQSQQDLVTPTGWWYQGNVTPQTVSDRAAQGYRLVDIEVEDDDPLRMSAVFVRNTGDYAKGWWWYYGLTEAGVNSRLVSNNARLIDVEPYMTAAGLRFAVVMIRNTGDDFASIRGWYYGQTAAQLQSFIDNNNGRRIIDVQPYDTGAGTRYAFTFVNNSGNLASGWWLYYNVTPSYISDRLSANNARLVDIEEQPGNTGRYSVIMKPNDGNAWWYYYNVSFAGIDSLTDQNAARLIDMQRTSSGLYNIIMRRNDNDLAINTNLGMRSRTDGDSGFLLREFNASTLAGVQEDEVFEPASLIKTFHHYHALRQVRAGAIALNTPIAVPGGGFNSCPEGIATGSFDQLGDVIWDMMRSSSNPDTEAVRRRFGTAAIEASAASVLATHTELNHIVGCLCGDPENETTLTDLYHVHDAVHDGLLGPFDDEFYAPMNRGLSNQGMGGFNFQTVLNQELNASSLSQDDRDEFESLVFAADKGGSYTCNTSTTSTNWRSRGGYIRVPFRGSRCDITERDYFVGAWVNDASNGTSAESAVGFGYTNLFRDRVRAAIDSWEATSCSTCYADCDGNNRLDVFDFLCFQDRFVSGNRAADCDGNGRFDVFDFLCFQDSFVRGCP